MISVSKLFAASICLASSLPSNSAFAEENPKEETPKAEAPATFLIDHDVLSWTKSRIKLEQGENIESDGLVSLPSLVTIATYWKDYGLYVTPGATGSNIGLSYYLTKELELGLLAGSIRSKVKNTPVDNGTAKLNARHETVGAFATYYLAINSQDTLETQATYLSDYDKETVKSNVDGTTTTTVNSRSNSGTILLQYAHQIAPHFLIVPGIYYTSAHTKNLMDQTKEKTDTLTVNLLHFRYSF